MVSAQVAERSVLTLEIWGSYPVIGKCISVNKWQICTIRHVFLQKSLLIAIKSSGTKQMLILRVTFQLRQMLCSVVDDCDVWPNECRYGQTGIGWPNGRRYGQTNVGMAKRTPWSSVFLTDNLASRQKKIYEEGGSKHWFSNFYISCIPHFLSSKHRPHPKTWHSENAHSRRIGTQLFYPMTNYLTTFSMPRTIYFTPNLVTIY